MTYPNLVIPTGCDYGSAEWINLDLATTATEYERVIPIQLHSVKEYFG